MHIRKLDGLILISDLEKQTALLLSRQLIASQKSGELPRIANVTATATEVLISGHLEDKASLTQVERLLPQLLSRKAHEQESFPTVHIPVTYDGPDLRTVGTHLGLSVGEVVAWHTSIPWHVSFMGFAPGFAYMEREENPVAIPRLASPRTQIPAGAVALGGPYCGIYPRPSPGGWQLIGSSTIELWNLQRTPEALLAGGTWVQFEAQ